MKTKTLLNFLLIACSIAFSTNAQVLDPSFGDNGIVTQSFEPSLNAAIRDAYIQKDGKIIQVVEDSFSSSYYYSLIRRTKDGALDPTFGFDGIITSPLNLLIAGAGVSRLKFIKLIVLPDDSFVLVWGSESINFSKFDSDGAYDTEYGFNGRFSKNFSGFGLGSPEAATLVGDGIVVTHFREFPSDNFQGQIDMKVTKIRIRGDIDRSFGDDGTYTHSAFQNEVRNFSRAVQDMRTNNNGDILLKSTTTRRSLNTVISRSELRKISPNGQLLSTFTAGSFEDTFFLKYAINRDDEVFALGDENRIFKLNSNLELDETFTATIPTEFNNNRFSRRVTVSDNDIITVSSIKDNTVKFIQFNSKGSVRSDFGKEGIGTITLRPQTTAFFPGIATANQSSELFTQGNKVIGVYGAGFELFTVRLDNKSEGETFSNFSLINGNTNKVITTIQQERRYPINLVENNYLNFRLNINEQEDIKSYKLSLEGPISFTRTENAAPYALFGDNNGNYFGKELLEGTYTIKAISFSEANGKGTEIKSLETSFTIINASPRVLDLIVFFADDLTFSRGTSLDVYTKRPLVQSDDIVYNFEADVNNFTSSVRLTLTGGSNTVSQLENVKPFALFGDVNGKFNSRMLEPGTYTLSATPYSQQLGKGFEGLTESVTFVVEDKPIENRVVIAPNPIKGAAINISIDSENNSSTSLPYEVIDMTGRTLQAGELRTVSGQKNYTIDTSDSTMKPGLYSLKLNSEVYSFVK